MIYTLVFWNRNFGWYDATIDPVLEENLICQIEEHNNNYEENPIVEPVFFCDSTEWRPSRLRKIQDFFYDIDTDRPDHFIQY